MVLNIYEIKMTQVKEEEAVSPAKLIKPKTAVLSVEKQKSQPKRVSIQIYLTNEKKNNKIYKSLKDKHYWVTFLVFILDSHCRVVYLYEDVIAFLLLQTSRKERTKLPALNRNSVKSSPREPVHVEPPIDPEAKSRRNHVLYQVGDLQSRVHVYIIQLNSFWILFLFHFKVYGCLFISSFMDTFSR